MTDDLPKQQQEGVMLQAALKAGGRSIRQVAPLAGMSEARWRQIVKGSMTANGQTVEVIAPASTLARMAYVLDLQPKQLIAAGRLDAADLLEHLQREAQRGTSVVPLPASSTGQQADEFDMIEASESMNAEQKLRAIRTVLRLRAQAEREAAQARQAAQAQQKAPASDAGAAAMNREG